MGGRNCVTGVFDGGAHAIAALSYCGIGQAHGVKVVLVRNHAAVIDLDVDQIGVDSINGSAESPEVRHGWIARSVPETRQPRSVMSATVVATPLSGPEIRMRDRLPTIHHWSLPTISSYNLSRDYESVRSVQNRCWAFQFPYHGPHARGVPLRARAC